MSFTNKTRGVEMYGTLYRDVRQAAASSCGPGVHFSVDTVVGYPVSEAVPMFAAIRALLSSINVEKQIMGEDG